MFIYIDILIGRRLLDSCFPYFGESPMVFVGSMFANPVESAAQGLVALDLQMSNVR